MEIDSPDPGEPAEQLLNFDFRRYLVAMRKYAWALLALLAIAVTVAVVFTNRQDRIYEATASVQIEPKLPDLLGQNAEPYAMNGGPEYYRQQKQVLSSWTLAHQTVEQNQLHLKLLSEAERAELKPEDQIDAATKKLQKMLTAKYPDLDRIMYIAVRGNDPALAAEIANDHVSTYLDYSKGLLSTDNKTASGALSSEFDAAEAALRTAEAAVYQFQKDNDLLGITLEDRQSLMSQNIQSFTLKLDDAMAKRMELTVKLALMEKASTEDAMTSPILMMGEDTSFDALRAQYYTEKNKLLELSQSVGPKNIEYLSQRAKVDDLNNALTSEAKRIMGGFRAQLTASQGNEHALGAQVDSLKKDALAFGPKIVAYNELVRRRRTAEDAYNILRTRLSTTEISGRLNSQSDNSFVKKLDPALVPTVPVGPNLKTNVAVAAVLALFIGIGVLFLIVFLDRSIKSTSDAQQAAQVPVLGVIPVLASSELPAEDTDAARDMYVHENPTSRVAECCRSLRTNILFSSADRQLKTIVVSSANPREGKTLSVIYLGTTMAQSGQRVLLVDTDMRRPRLHVSLKLERDRGLSNLILGDMTYDEVIKQSAVPNMSVLTCGPLPPNPAELIMTKRFETVIAELSTRFDRIIFDSPPLQAVTDAVVLSKLVDGTILVVRAGKTQRDEIKRSVRQIRDVRSPIFGVIVNEFDASDRAGYYYSGYYYGYGKDGAPGDGGPRAGRRTSRNPPA